MIATSRLIAALAYAGAAFFFGLALGERGELGVVQYAFLIGVPVAAIVLATFAKHARLEVLLTGLTMFAGLVAGQASFERAFEECRSRAVVVHKAIEQYTAKHGEFPRDLSVLSIEVPCECILRDTILHYVQNERSYRLWFTNDFETVTATERSSIPPRR